MNRIGIYAVKMPKNYNSYIIGLDSVADNKVSVTLYQVKKGSPVKEQYSVETDCDIVDQRDYDFSEVFAEERKQFSIFIDRFNKLSDPVFHGLLSSREGTALLQLIEILNNSPFMKFMAIGGDYCIIAEYPLVTELDYVVTDVQGTNPLFEDFFGGAAESLTYYEARSVYKRKMLMMLNPNDSLSTIDAQLDILTKLIFMMYDNLTIEDKSDIETAFPELAAYRSAVEATNILNVKPFYDCMKEIDAKTKIRDMQTAYYSLKQQI